MIESSEKTSLASREQMDAVVQELSQQRFWKKPLGLLARGLSMGFGCFSLFNLSMTRLLDSPIDANQWWVMMTWFPSWVADGLLILFSVFALAYAFVPGMSKLRKLTFTFVCGLLLLATLSNSIDYLLLIESGRLGSDAWFPFSLLVSFSIAVVICGAWFGLSFKRGWFNGAVLLFVLLFMFGSFPMTQIQTLGRTDYTRQNSSDVAVVFGARAFPDGRLSDVLQDRVDTAIGLYHDGHVGKIIMTGGPVNDEMHETEAMRDYAIEQGVPASHVLVDREGVNTMASAESVAEMVKQQAEQGKDEYNQVLVVSNHYHLPRIKMAFQIHGLSVRTTPAKERYFYSQTPWMYVRETAAFWVYYAQGIGMVMQGERH